MFFRSISPAWVSQIRESNRALPACPTQTLGCSGSIYLVAIYPVDFRHFCLLESLAAFILQRNLPNQLQCVIFQHLPLASHHSQSFVSTYYPQVLCPSCASGTSDVLLVQMRKPRHSYHKADGAAPLPPSLLSYSSLLPSTYNQLLWSSSFISSQIHALVHLFIHSLHITITF